MRWTVRRLLRSLQSRAWPWGLGYVALIPIFATVYSTLPPGNFHDSNIEHEQALTGDAARLRMALTREVIARASGATWRGPQGRRWRLDAATVNGVDHTDDGRLLIEVEGSDQATNPGRPLQLGTFAYWVELDLLNSTFAVLNVVSGMRTRSGAAVVSGLGG